MVGGGVYSSILVVVVNPSVVKYLRIVYVIMVDINDNIPIKYIMLEVVFDSLWVFMFLNSSLLDPCTVKISKMLIHNIIFIINS